MLPYFTQNIRNSFQSVRFPQLTVISLFFLQAACGMFGDREPDEIPEQELPVRREYRKGHTVKNSFPLPSMTPVWLDEIRGTKRISSRLAYRGWDMNDDGRFDMLESLSPQGTVIFRAYDLDFDGLVDEVEQLREEAPSKNQGKPLDGLINQPPAGHSMDKPSLSGDK